MPKRENPNKFATHSTREDVVWGNIDPDDYEDVQLAPLERRRHAIRESILPLDIVYEEEDEQTAKYQFGIRHMLIAQACMAILLGLMQVFAPSLLAGTLGITVLVLAILLAVYKPEERRIQVIWWAIFSFYLVACIVAFVRG